MAQRATSLGPQPSLFFCVFLCFPLEKPCFFPPKKHFCLVFSVSLCFSLAFFGLSLFHFLFLCLSLSCSFLSSFLPVSHFCFWFLLFVLFCLLSVSCCSFVVVFLLVVLLCFESQYVICFCFAYCCCCCCCCSFLFLLLGIFYLIVGCLSKNISQKFGYGKKQK